jgi:hypothetical protein
MVEAPIKKTFSKEIQDINDQVSGLLQHKCDFWDHKEFLRFYQEITGSPNRNRIEFSQGHGNYFDVMGYFDDPMFNVAEIIIKNGIDVRILTRAETINSKKLSTVKKLVKLGAKIRYNDKIHARLINSYNVYKWGIESGEVIIGSFDFDRECISSSRRDAGIHTRDLEIVESVANFFDGIWEDGSETFDIPPEDLKIRN